MSLTWSHTENDPATTAPAAIEAARNGAWASLDAATRLRYLRLLLLMTHQVGQMTSTPPRPRGPEGPVEYGIYQPGQYRDRQSLEIASTVLRTPQLVLPAGAYSVRSATTIDGEGVVTEGDEQTLEVGALPVVVVVIGIAACAIASVVIAQMGLDVIDRQLTRSDDTKRLLGSQASAVEILANHAKREEQSGKAIPYSAEEIEVVNGLQKTQLKIAEQRQTPLPSPFKGAADAFGDAVKGVKDSLEGMTPWLIGGGVAFWLLSRSKGS